MIRLYVGLVVIPLEERYWDRSTGHYRHRSLFRVLHAIERRLRRS